MLANWYRSSGYRNARSGWRTRFARYPVVAELVHVQAHFGEPVERDPLRERLVAQVAAGSRRAAHRDHQRGQAERDDQQRDQHLDQRESRGSLASDRRLASPRDPNSRWVVLPNASPFTEARRLRLIAQQGEAKRRAFAARRDGHLRRGRRLIVDESALDGLEHDATESSSS